MTVTRVQPEAEELRRRLAAGVAGEVRFDPYTRALYATDASIYQIEPVGVVLPRSADDVQAVIEICRASGTSVLPRGGGTGLSGQTVNRAVVVDFSKYMHNVLEINAEERRVRTQPGITIDELNRQVRPYGLMFTPDPSTSSRANVGGAMGNNSCGAHSIIYGKTVDHVLEMEVVLSDGTRTRFQRLDGATLQAKLNGTGLEGDIYRKIHEISQRVQPEVEKRFPKILRRVGGYNLDRIGDPRSLDLTQIMVGSEGTLASVIVAKLNLVPIPRHRVLAVVHFAGIREAMEATVATLETSPAAVEHIGSIIINQAKQSLGFSRELGFIQGDPEDLLVVEFSGDDEAEVRSKLDVLEARLKREKLGYAVTRLLTPESQDPVWNMRKAGLGLMMNVKGDAKPLPFVEDTAVSPEKLPEYVTRFDEIVRRHGTTAGYYGHASVGCLHIRPLINLKTREGMDRLYAIARDVSDLVAEFEGALTGEHGDGIVRGFWNEKIFGANLVQAFREVKAAFDPAGIMNPGKIIDTPHLTENLRYGEGYRTASVPARLDFTREGGFAGAVEMCNGVGQCRKVNVGVMCPSYMATREEEHSTRGRANALRFALSGKIPVTQLSSKRMFEVLDLCLECKSCKAECPSNVDMAKIKAEFLYQYQRENGTPLRSRLIANVHRMNAVRSRFAPLSNVVTRSIPARWVLDRVVGLDATRPTPPVARQTFEQWFEGRAGRSTGSRGRVVLFHDTYMNFNYPSIGIAATRLLEALGYEVLLVKDRVCCGKPMFSKGLLDQAGKHARRNVDLLYPFAQQGTKIVGCEASCVGAMKDEWPALLGRDEPSLTVAGAVTTVDSLMTETAGDGQQQITFSGTKSRVLFFAHCHQRALLGTRTSMQALKLPPGYEVSEIAAGCCGMAGSFGYEKEHVALSKACGEDRLFPAIRALSPDTEIAVTGISCREQIQFETGRTPRHLVEVLADALPT